MVSEETRERYKLAHSTPVRYRNQESRIVSLTCDDPVGLQTLMRLQGREGPVVAIIQSRDRYRTAILANPKKVWLKEIAWLVRRQELLIGGVTEMGSKADLEVAGVADDVPEWNHIAENGMLLSGFGDEPNTPSTRVPLAHLIELVRLSLASDEFDQPRRDQCRQGVCTHTAEKTCPMFALQLKRCLHVRKGR
jgi:hypothetical protein